MHTLQRQRCDSVCVLFKKMPSDLRTEAIQVICSNRQSGQHSAVSN